MAPWTKRYQMRVFISFVGLAPFLRNEASSRLARLSAENAPWPLFCHRAKEAELEYASTFVKWPLDLQWFHRCIADMALF